MLAIEAGIKVSPLPGANAALSALICSGLDTTAFTFYGFLPKSSKKRTELLQRIAASPETLIFYEAPHHLMGTLELLSKYFGQERAMVAARELTKKFEEFCRGTIGEIQEYFQSNEPRGEFVLVVEGAPQDTAPPATLEEAVQDARQRVAQGLSASEAARQAAAAFGFKKGDSYRLLQTAPAENDTMEE